MIMSIFLASGLLVVIIGLGYEYLLMIIYLLYSFVETIKYFLSHETTHAETLFICACNLVCD